MSTVDLGDVAESRADKFVAGQIVGGDIVAGETGDEEFVDHGIVDHEIVVEEMVESGIVADEDVVGALEAVLLIVESPVPEAALATALGHGTDRIHDELVTLAGRYTRSGSGIELRSVGGGWRFYTRDRFAPVVEKFVLDGQQAKLSKAALETLAVIAYRQPVTRARISGVRGVNVDGVIRTLTSRGLVEEFGTDPDTGGMLHRTTELFLERLGLSSLEDLPSLGPLLPEIDTFDDE